MGIGSTAKDLLTAGKVAAGEIINDIAGIAPGNWKALGLNSLKKAGIGAAVGAGVGAGYSALSGDGRMGHDIMRGAMMGGIGYGGYTGGRAMYEEAQLSRALSRNAMHNTTLF